MFNYKTGRKCCICKKDLIVGKNLYGDFMGVMCRLLRMITKEELMEFSTCDSCRYRLLYS